MGDDRSNVEQICARISAATGMPVTDQVTLAEVESLAKRFGADVAMWLSGHPLVRPV